MNSLLLQLFSFLSTSPFPSFCLPFLLLSLFVSLSPLLFSLYLPLFPFLFLFIFLSFSYILFLYFIIFPSFLHVHSTFNMEILWLCCLTIPQNTVLWILISNKISLCFTLSGCQHSLTYKQIISRMWPHLQLVEDMWQRTGPMFLTGRLVCGDQVLAAHVFCWKEQAGHNIIVSLMCIFPVSCFILFHAVFILLLDLAISLL